MYFPWIFPFDPWIIERYVVSSTSVWRLFSYISDFDLYLDATVAENTLYDFHSSEFVKRCLWPRIQSVLAYVLKKMCNLLFLCGVLNMLLTYCDLMVLLNSSTSYWFSVIVLPIIERDAEKFQTMTTDWSISPFSSISCCLVYFVTLFLVHMHLGLLSRFGRLTLLLLCNFPLFPC